jgi:hypothetical protein
MKQMFLSLTVSFASCAFACAQSEPAATLGMPRPAATLGMPRPASSDRAKVLPTNFSDPGLQLPGAPPALSGVPVVPSAPPVVNSAPPALDPVSPSPYRLIDTPQRMPKNIGVSDKFDSPLPTPSMVPPPKTGALAATPGLDCDDPFCPLPACLPTCANQDHFRLSAEYLMWWTPGFRAPPLVTTGPATSDGIIGQPGVSTLAGDERISPTFRSGVRMGFDWFFGPRQVWGLDGHFFYLGTNTSNETFSSDQYPLLARPFFNVNNNTPFSEIVASPGLLTGSIAIHTMTSLLGGDLNLRRKLFQNDAWTFDAFAGYRYLRLAESFKITEDVALAPGATNLPSTIPANFISASAYDKFSTLNNFNGSQVGLFTEYNLGRWSFNARSSIAMGVTTSSLDIIGSQTSVFTTGPVTTPSGLLALNSNIGHYEKNTFAVVPEGTFNIGYNVTQRCRLFVGYNVLWISSVLRPGDQINTNLDVNRIPGFPTTTSTLSSVTPYPSLHDRSFYAQGVNFGVMFHW